ncbi:hypothetical protein [Oscillatoria sp. FACHB-1407]|nr:hypothetical protein [Oscillatoria sp. FACHB-1407]
MQLFSGKKSTEESDRPQRINPNRIRDHLSISAPTLPGCEVRSP